MMTSYQYEFDICKTNIYTQAVIFLKDCQKLLLLLKENIFLHNT